MFDATDATTRLPLAAVEATYDLSDFHAEGQLNTRREQATIDGGDPTLVHVPADGLAQVTMAAGGPAAPALDRHVQILMGFDTAHELRWGDVHPAGEAGALSQTDLLAWAARYPQAQFLVVGRCDDVGSASPSDNDSYNRSLARTRAARGVTLLTELQKGETGTVVEASRRPVQLGGMPRWRRGSVIVVFLSWPCRLPRSTSTSTSCAHGRFRHRSGCVMSGTSWAWRSGGVSSAWRRSTGPRARSTRGNASGPTAGR